MWTIQRIKQLWNYITANEEEMRKAKIVRIKEYKQNKEVKQKIKEITKEIEKRDKGTVDQRNTKDCSDATRAV